MSYIKKMLEDLAKAQDDGGIHSGERKVGKDDKLKSHSTVDDIDPLSIADIDTEKEFQKKVDKEVKGEAKDNDIEHIFADLLDDKKKAPLSIPGSIISRIAKGLKTGKFNKNDVKRIGKTLKLPQGTIDLLLKRADQLKESQMMTTQMSGHLPHVHNFEVGEIRTTVDDGHDHSIVYEDGKPVRTGPGPRDGHIHEI